MGTYVDLLKACKEGNHRKVKKLLVNCKNIGDVRDITDRTLLHYCFKFEECADLILAASPDLLDTGDRLGYTVLHLASMIKPSDTLRYILSKQPDINKRNNDSRTPLLLAVIYENYDAIKLLCECKADVNVIDSSGISPLHYVAKSKSDQNEEYHLKIIDLLLEFGADIEFKDYYDRSPLIWAVSSNNITKMRHLIAREGDINTRDCTGLSILHYATSNGNLDIISILLDEYQFNIESFDNNGCTSLMYACTLNRLNVVHFLLENGADPNAEDQKRRTSVYFTSGKGDLDCLKLLHSYRANLWKLNSDSNFPIHEASYRGYSKVVEYLIKNPPTDCPIENIINHRNTNNQTPLHLASVKDDLEICRLLLENRADPNIVLRATNGKSMTALDLANKSETKEIMIKFNGKTADDLIKREPITEESSDSSTELTSDEEEDEYNTSSVTDASDGSKRSSSKSDVLINDTPNNYNDCTIQQKEFDEFEESVIINDQICIHLLESCYNGEVNNLIAFARKGGSLYDIMDPSGKNLLHFSLKSSNCFEYLCQTVPSLVNKPDALQRPTLHLAVMSKENKRLKMLLAIGADYNFTDISGQTVLHLCVIYKNFEALEILHEEIEDKSSFVHQTDNIGNFPLHYAVELFKTKEDFSLGIDFIKLLLKMNGDVECVDSVKRTPLLLAVNVNNYDAVVELINNGANILAQDNQGLSSVHYVAAQGNLEILNELAKSQEFDSNLPDPNGLTPVFYAVASCNDKVMQRLINLGASINVRDKHGRSLCHKAAEKGAFKCLELLISLKIDPWSASHDGSLPLHDAAYRGYKEIAEILLNAPNASQYVNTKNVSGQTALHLAAVRNDCPMCFLLISQGSKVNELLHDTVYDVELTAYDLATTPYCKETLYDFGGRSAKIVTSPSNDDNTWNEYCEGTEGLLNVLKMDENNKSTIFSVRSTELALSTLPSVIHTNRTNILTGTTSASNRIEVENSEVSKKESDKSEKNFSSDSASCISNEKLKPILNAEISREIFEDISFSEKNQISTINMEQPLDIKEIPKLPFSDPIILHSKPKSRPTSIKSSSRKTTKSNIFSSNDKRRTNYQSSRSIQNKVQNSILEFEYIRLNTQIAIELARYKIRKENIEKLINPKTPKLIRHSKVQRPKDAKV